MKKRRVISPSMEDYLKTIYTLSQDAESVSTSEIATHMGCAPASVTNMLQKLSSLQLAEYKPYKGVRLTEAGSKIALEVVRHHRLIELYLAEILGYSWDQVHDEADRLEHVISEELEAKMDEALGYPERDPHGDPIPTREGKLPYAPVSSIWEAPVGEEELIVVRVSDRNPEVLRYLAEIGIYPRVKIRVTKKAPFNGPVSVGIGDVVHDLSQELATQIYVEPAEPVVGNR
jgi:DtxR family Mn-dependent transcriptional regulator